MKFTIVTTVLLGLLLSPALADNNAKTGNENLSGGSQIVNGAVVRGEMKALQVPIDGGFQILTINSKQRVASVQQESNRGSWKAIGNYNTGAVAIKLLSERVCYVSKVNLMELPNFDELLRLVDDKTIMKRLPVRDFTFVIGRPIHDLRSYGQDIVDLCRGLPTYVADQLNGPQDQYDQGSCLKVDVMNNLYVRFCDQPEQIVEQGLEAN